jgi:hypothetical protein
MQKIPIIGQNFVKEIPPSDNVRLNPSFSQCLRPYGAGQCMGRVGILGVERKSWSIQATGTFIWYYPKSTIAGSNTSQAPGYHFHSLLTFYDHD